MENDDIRFAKPVTDPCAECAMKHLSAAYSLAVDGWASGSHLGFVMTARAYVNLSEFVTGYESHWGLAAGYLARAEEAFNQGLSGHGETVRRARRILTDNPFALDAASDAMTVMEAVAYTGMYVAHLAEARREYPLIAEDVERWSGDPAAFIEDFSGAIKAIGNPVDPAKGKESEEVMAKCAKKADAKKAACKGGKCAVPAKKAAKKSCKK